MNTQHDVQVRLSTIGTSELTSNMRNVEGVMRSMSGVFNEADAGTKRLSATFRQTTASGEKYSITVRQLADSHRQAAAASKEHSAAGDVLGGSLVKMIASIAAFTAIYKAIDAVKSFISAGVDLQATLETSQLGIAATILSYRQYSDESGKVVTGQRAMSLAMSEGANIQKLLQREAFNTTATLEQMLKGYQQLQAGAATQKVTSQELAGFVGTLGNLATATGRSFDELSAQTGRVLQGVLTIRNPIVALLRGMGVSNDTIRSWIDQGIAISKIQERLIEFQNIGGDINKTWAGVKSNLEDVFQQFGAGVMAPMMDSMKSVGNSIVSVFTESFEQGGRRVTQFKESVRVDAAIIGESLRLAFEGSVEAIQRMWNVFTAGAGSSRDIVTDIAVKMAHMKSMIGDIAEGLALLTQVSRVPAKSIFALAVGGASDMGKKQLDEIKDLGTRIKTFVAEIQSEAHKAKVAADLVEDLFRIRAAGLLPSPDQTPGIGTPRGQDPSAAMAATVQQFKDFKAVMESKFDMSGLSGVSKALAEHNVQFEQANKSIDAWAAKLGKLSGKGLAQAGLGSVADEIERLKKANQAALGPGGFADQKALAEAERKYAETLARIGKLASDSAQDEVETWRIAKQQELDSLTKFAATYITTSENTYDAVMDKFVELEEKRRLKSEQIDIEAARRRTQPFLDAELILNDKLLSVTRDYYVKQRAEMDTALDTEIKNINKRKDLRGEEATILIGLAEQIYDARVALLEEEKNSIIGYRRTWEEEYQRLVRSTDSMAGGVAAGFAKIKSQLKSTTESVSELVVSIGNSLRSALETGIFDVITGKFENLGDVLKSLWDSMLKDFSKMLAQMLERWIMTGELMGEGGEGQGGFAGIFKAFGGGKTGSTAGTGGRTNYGEIDEWGDETPGSYTYSGGKSGGGGLGQYGAYAAYAYGAYQGISSIFEPHETSRPTYQGQDLGQTADFGGPGGGAALTAAVAVLGVATAATAALVVSGLTLSAAMASAVPVVGWIVAAVLLIVAALMTIFAGPEEGHVKVAIKDAFDKNNAQSVIGHFVEGIIDSTANFVGSIALKAAGPEGIGKYVTSYQDAFKKAYGRATFDIAAGDKDDLQKDVDTFFNEILPKIAMQAAFGQSGFGQPLGDRDWQGGAAGLDWNTNNDLMDAQGNFLKKQLYDPNAPIPLLLAGIGFTADAIGEIATKLSTSTDMKVFKQWLMDLVGVVVDLQELAKKFGQTRDEWYAFFRTEGAKEGTAAQFEAQTASLRAGGELLATMFGDERVAAGKELVTQAQALLQNQAQALSNILNFIDQIQTQLTQTAQGYRDRLLTPGEREAVLRERATTDYAAIVDAANPKEAAAAWQKVLSDMTALLDIIVARIQAIKALQQSYADFRTQMAMDAGPQFGTDPAAWLAQNQSKIDALQTTLLTATGDEAVSSARELLGLVKERYANELEMLRRVRAAIAAVNDQVDAAVSALNLQAMGSVQNGQWVPDVHAQGQAMWAQIQELEGQLKTASTPEAAQRIWNQITSLLGQLASQPQDPAHYAESRRILQKAWEDAGLIFDTRMGEIADDLELDLSTIGDQLEAAEVSLASVLGDAEWDFEQALHNLGLASDAATEKLNGFADELVTAMNELVGAIRTWIEFFTTAEVDKSASPSDTDIWEDDPLDPNYEICVSGASKGKRRRKRVTGRPGAGEGPGDFAPPPLRSFTAPPINVMVTVNSGSPEEIADLVVAAVRPEVVATVRQNNVELARAFRNNPSLLQRSI